MNVILNSRSKSLMHISFSLDVEGWDEILRGYRFRFVFLTKPINVAMVSTKVSCVIPIKQMTEFAPNTNK